MLKTFSGSWFEFQHHNPPEGKYWNPVCRAFSEEQWREKVREMKSLDMKYIVLLCTSLVYEDYAEAYFKTDIYPFAENFGCADPIAALMDEASKCGMKVFVSVGYYGPWTHTHENMISRDVEKRAFQSMEELYARFGRYDSFFGWYYPDESGITKYFDPDFIDYINRYSAFGRSLGKDLRILVAPYGTNHLLADDTPTISPIRTRWACISRSRRTPPPITRRCAKRTIRPAAPRSGRIWSYLISRATSTAARLCPPTSTGSSASLPPFRPTATKSSSTSIWG